MSDESNHYQSWLAQAKNDYSYAQHKNTLNSLRREVGWNYL
jgi:hypothetical protein